MKLIHKTMISLIGAILLIMIGLVVLFSFFGQIEQEADYRRQHLMIIHDANELMSAMKDAETGERGYLLTGDENFLQPYGAVLGQMSGRIDSLRRHSTNSIANQKLNILAPLIEAKLADMAYVIDLRRRGDISGAEASVREGKGKQIMDDVRLQMSSFLVREEALLKQSDAKFSSDMRRLFIIIVTTSLFAILLSFLYLYLMYVQNQQRLKNGIHAETQHLLAVQEESNKQLQRVNLTLQISEEKLAVTLSSIGDGVIATDARARVTLMNPIAEQLTGWTQAEAIGRPVAEVFHIISKETRDFATIPVMETLANGTIQGLANHTVLIARDGSECDIADSCAPIFQRDAHIVMGAVLVFRNVTADYAIQQALRDGTALVQTILNTVVDGIITFQACGGEIGTVNHTVETLFGYASEEVIGQNLSLLIPELDQDPCNMCLSHISDNDGMQAQGVGRNVIGRRKDGSTFSLELAASEMWLGGQRYFTGILRDVTARKQAEAALLEAGALQRAIFDSAYFSSIATDEKGVIQIFNVGAERMLGYAATDVINKITPADISDPQEVISRAEALSAELATPIQPGFEALVFKASRGIEDIYELTYIRKDGSRFPAVVSVTALRAADNKIIGYLLIGTDNTARKRVEEEQKKLDQRLRDQQFYTRSLIESNIDALMTTDPSGIITDVNKQMEALTECTRDELIGAPFKNYFTSPELAEKAIKQVLNEKKVTDYELTVCARDGKKTVVSYNATTFYDRDRKLQGVFAAARDVTERKRLDEILQEKNTELQSAKSIAEKANLAKSDFLSSMSHELRTPLSAILGFTQLIDSGTPQPTSSQKRSIDQILKAGWYLLELINEILDLALIESGKLSLSMEPVLLAEVMHECWLMVEPQTLKRGIHVTFPQFLTPHFVQADRTRLKQVLINLLSNAIKYNRNGGRVVVSCHLNHLNLIRIGVEDTGEGLSPEQISQLFQPFNRLGQEAHSEEGTGIGLVVCKRLVELMGGIVGVDSTVGVGSVFWFELSLTDEPKASLSTAETLTKVTPTIHADAPLYTLLYIEDNPANLMLVEDIVARRPDIRLLSAMDGKSGIKIAHAMQPDIILMDINLPGISGLKALRILAESTSTTHIPVIALSANAMPRDIEKGMEAGFFRYLTKPIKVNEFMETLDVALKQTKTTTASSPILTAEEKT